MKLFKYDQLEDDDEDIPISQYIGLSLNEFFDAILSASRLLDDKTKTDDDNPFVGGLFGDNPKKELYATLDDLVVNYLNEYIYKNQCKLEEYMNGKEIKVVFQNDVVNFMSIAK